MDAPREDLVRARFELEELPSIGLRAEGDGDQRTLFGHFAVFNKWTEIRSWEGNFLERFLPGAFTKTIAESRSRMKVLYDHGFDPQLGNKPLGPINDLREDKVGAYYEVSLIDTDYNRGFVIPALDAGLLGASFRFSVVNETWNHDPGKSRHNPKGLPERSVTESKVREFGPVTFPAYEAASAGIRSQADLRQFLASEEGRAALAELMVRATDLRTPPVDGGAASPTTEPAPATPRVTRSQRRQRAAELRGVAQ